MLDTVKLKRPLVDEREASLIEARVQTMTKTDNASGEELFRFVGGSLEGSWSNNIAVNVKREVYKRVRPSSGEKPYSVTIPCGWEPGQPRPFLTIEGSVHKAMCGHNVHGGPLDPVAASLWFAVHVCGLLGINVGDFTNWLCLRLDWAECYNFGNFEAVDEFLRAMKLANYPRRSPLIYPGEVMFPSSNITTKFYHKGLEFKENGFDAVKKGFRRSIDNREPSPLLRLSDMTKEQRRGVDIGASIRDEFVRMQGILMGPEEVAIQLQNLANGILRTEITVKSKRLKVEYERILALRGQAVIPGHAEMPVVELKRDSFEELHDTEVSRVFHEGKADMKTVRNHDEVHARLRYMYGGVNGRPEMLFGVWMRLSALGEAEYRKTVTRTTFYRQTKMLSEAGITWIGSDIGIVSSNIIPLDFSFRRDSPYRMTEELPEVTDLQLPFRRAA